MRHFIFAFAAASLLGCAVSAERPDESGAAQNEEALRSDGGCHYRCQPCPPGRVCIQVCEPVGKCARACTTIALCIEGYRWDEAKCACVADPATPVTCGTATCGAGQVCCNASCGICTDPGGFCTQQACTSTTGS
jgi:hypothetical protein